MPMSKHSLSDNIQKVTWKQTIRRLFLFLLIFIIIEFSSSFMRNKIDNPTIENLKFEYVVMDEKLKNSLESLQNLQIKSLSIIQYRSFITMIDQANERKIKIEHLPLMRPVSDEIPLGEGIKFRAINPILGISIWHQGQDFPAPIGTEVYATGAGKICTQRDTTGLGNCIIIEHGYGYKSIYGHLSKFIVKEGDIVKRGYLIGLIGSTGRSTGPHLHYQINLYNKYQNPSYFFNKNLTIMLF